MDQPRIKTSLSSSPSSGSKKSSLRTTSSQVLSSSQISFLAISVVQCVSRLSITSVKTPFLFLRILITVKIKVHFCSLTNFLLSMMSIFKNYISTDPMDLVKISIDYCYQIIYHYSVIYYIHMSKLNFLLIKYQSIFLICTGLSLHAVDTYNKYYQITKYTNISNNI